MKKRILISLIFFCFYLVVGLILSSEVSANTLIWEQDADYSAGSDMARAITSDNDYIYIAGEEDVFGDSLWRVEKRRKSDGGVEWSLAVDYAPGENDQPESIVADNNYLYTVGIDEGAGGTKWRIEKRRKSDGFVEATVVNNYTALRDNANDVIEDSSFIYVVGEINLGDLADDEKWLIEKRRKSDLGVEWSIEKNYSSSANCNKDSAEAVVEDGDYIYVGGQGCVVGPPNQDFQWYTIKLRKSDGGEEWEQAMNHDAYIDVLRDIAIDGTYIYLIGSEQSAGGDREIFLDKRRKSDGGLEWSQRINPTVGIEDGEAVDVDENYLYIGGWSIGEWYIEKRRKSDGEEGWTLSVDIDSGGDLIYDLVVDNDYIYLAGYGRDGSNRYFHIEKRSKSVFLPCVQHNVWGYAWSENVGWISFSCKDTMAEGDYGVDICEDGDSRPICSGKTAGTMVGYAWSENIGWVTFNSADLGGCPSGTCEASIDLLTGEVSGWARALAAPEAGANSGGWDGWIRLRDTNYGVWLDSSVSPAEFHNWAWGGDDSSEEAVIGWISFNCAEGGNGGANICATSDYKVMTDLSLTSVNDPAYVDPGSTKKYEDYCNNTPTPQVGFEWTYEDNEDDEQAEYDLQVSTQQTEPGFTNNLVVDINCNQVSCLGITTSPNDDTDGVYVLQDPTTQTTDRDLGYNDTYYWRVRVKAVAVGDSDTSWSDWEYGPSFSTPVHPKPKCSFTPQPANPQLDQSVDFIDNSICYTATESYLCKNNPYGLLSSYKWDFNYPPFSVDDNTEGNTNYTYTEANGYSSGQNIKVRLEVTDDAGTCPHEATFTLGAAAPTLPLPHWREIAPF